MHKIAVGVLGTLVVSATIGAVALFGGLFDVAADTPHGSLVFELLSIGRERSIARQSRDVVPPVDLTSTERIRRGSGNYAAMCAECHLAPAMPDTELRRGLYPQPPNLTQPYTTDDAPAHSRRTFWIIKHGIKASAMAAWSKSGMSDDDIWNLVAFLQRLPTLSPQQYRALASASDGHAHTHREH